MQKGISYFFACLFVFQIIFPQTSFSMIQMTKDQFNKSTLCIYYMLWNIDRKCSPKVVQKLLYSQYEQENCIKEGEGAPFMEFWSRVKMKKEDPFRIWKYLLKKKQQTNPKHPTINHSELFLPRKVWGSFSLIIKFTAAWKVFVFVFND